MMKLFFAIACMLSHFAFAEVVETAATTTAVSLPTSTEKSAYDEAAIPLKLAADKAQMGEKQNSSAKMTLGFIIVAVLLTGGIFYIRRFAANKKSNETLMQIKVVAQHYLGPKKSVAVIRVAGESLLIGITDNQINLIKGLAVLDDDMTHAANQSVFPKLNTEDTDADAEQMNTAADEEFSFADLKSTVADKLKSVRGFQ
jgi:flagellar protein FliO/FliZ